MKLKKTITILSLVALVSGCSTLTQTEKASIGAVSGAILGGVVGHQVNHGGGKYVGAVLGALAGGAITYYMTEQQQDLEQALAKSGISVSRINDSTIKINLPETITFAVNQSNLNPAVYQPLGEIATVLNKYPKTAIHVLGFTDNTGSAQYNLNLSQQRASSVSSYLAAQGVVSGRMVVRGYGEAHPIASNATSAGRAKNRRAEIYIRAIEKGNEQAAYNPIF